MTHGGGTRGRPVRTYREETPVRRMGCAGPAIYDGDPTWLKELAVERFPVDVDPGQIVRWIMAEHKATYVRFGIDQARRGWLTADDVINTRPLSALRKMLRRPAAAFA